MQGKEQVLFTWVHISDIHFGHGKASHRWDQALVLKQLKYDISLLESRKIPKPNAIFVTGDIAFSGDTVVHSPDVVSREYEKAEEWFLALTANLRIDKSEVFMVPGNHDVQRNAYNKDRGGQRLLERLRIGDESIDEALAYPDDNASLIKRFSNYLKFVAKFSASNITPNKLYWRHSINTPSGFRIHLIGLNTAILSADDQDLGKLRLGREQLEAEKEFSKSDPNSLVVALSHHPFEWLADGQEIGRLVSATCHVHLCGHVHDSESLRIRSGGGSDFIRLVAGATHNEARETTGHGYTVVALVANTRGEVFLRLWPRVWSAKNADFRLDAHNVPDGEMFAEHKLECKFSLLESTLSNTVTEMVTIVDSQDDNSECSERESIPSPEPHPANDPMQISEPSSHLTIHDCDLPPSTAAWVGRTEELKLLVSLHAKVIAVTGIGGQGKSCLVATFLHQALEAKRFSFWDWRDCREEGDTLQTHLLRIIERLSAGEVKGSDLTDAETPVLIRIFFQVLGDRQGLFVFDNVDHYVDSDGNWLVRGMKPLIEAALKLNHNSCIVFTCRPSVVSEDSNFFQMALSGLSVAETQKLFELRGVDTSTVKLRKGVWDAHAATQGHPLWLNIIATQVSKNKMEIDGLIANLQQGKGKDTLPTKLLRSIWGTLKSNEQHLLRCLAESVRPETAEQLSNYLEDLMTWNRFSKSLKVLTSLNLVVTKTAPNTKDTLELHPLLREFVALEFSTKDRKKFIDIIAKWFDSFIGRYKSQISSGASFGVLENWIYRAELAINSGDFREAFCALEDIIGPIFICGYSEAFVRVGTRLFSKIEWADVRLNDYKGFDYVLEYFIDALSIMGRFDDAEYYLYKYEQTIVGKSAAFINLCSLRCHYFWSKKDYASAKRWGEQGEEVRTKTGLNPSSNCGQHLALAQRDSGEVEKALQYFLRGHELNDFISKEEVTIVQDQGGTFFGNIGRCLWLLGNVEGALIAYKKSLYRLESPVTPGSISNRGWGCLWVGEALEKLGQFDLAYCFYMRVRYLCSSVSPPKVAISDEKIAKLLANHGSIITLQNASESEIEIQCKNWINGNS